MKKYKISIPALILAVLGITLCAGVLTFLHPCRHADGTLAACHAAGVSLTRTGAAIAVLALAAAFIDNKYARTALFAACALLGAWALFTPGIRLSLCMMETMRCHTVTKPAARVLGALAALLGLGLTARQIAFIIKEKKA